MDHIFPTYNKTEKHHHYKRDKRGTLKKSSTKARRKTIRANMKFCVKILLKPQTPFRFVSCNILLSLVLVPHLVCSSGFREWHCHLQHLENSSTTQAGFTFKASWNSLSRPPCRHTTDTCLAKVAFCTCGGRFHNHFFYILAFKVRTTWLKLPSSAACWGWNLSPRFKYILYQLSLVGFLHCLSFSLKFFTSWQLRWVVSFQELTTIFTQLSIRQVSFLKLKIALRIW